MHALNEEFRSCVSQMRDFESVSFSYDTELKDIEVKLPEH